MNKRFTPLIVCLLLSSLLLTSCNDSTSTVPTLTLDLESCTYSGPKTVPANFSIEWTINDDTAKNYAYVLVTLDKDKTQADLEEYLTVESDNPPTWLTIISRDIAASGNFTETKVHNLTANAAYKGEPIYIICFIGDKSFVAAGPLKVKK